MATIQTEQDLVEQYLKVTTEVTGRMRPVIIGPDFVARKYETNKASVLLGTYTGAAASFGWPGIQAGEVVQDSFTKLFIDGAAQRYYNSNAGAVAGGGTASNRISSATVNWATATGYPRSGTVPADAQVGDWIRVTGSIAIVGQIQQLIGDPVAATIDTTPNAAVANKATQVGSSSASTTAGTGTAVPSVSGLNNQTNYSGAPVGLIGDTYVIECEDATNGSGNAGTWNGVRLRIYSVSGKDYTLANSQYVTLGGAGLTYADVSTTGLVIGSLGCKVKLSHGVSGSDWTVGTRVEVVVAQSFTEPTAVAAGTYTGPQDTDYIIKVTRGGPSGTAQITVTTSNSVDSQPAQTITTAVAFPLGAYGVTATLTGTAFVLGDTWVVPCTAATTGRIGTIVLNQDLGDLASESNLNVELAILENIQVSQNRIGHAPVQNWTTSPSAISVNNGIITTDPRTGALELPVVDGTVYCSYRVFRTQFINQVQVAYNETSLDNLYGGTAPADDVDNGLVYAVRRAFTLANAAAPIYFVAVGSDDVPGYQAALVPLLERDDFYNIVPLSRDTAVQDLIVSFVNQQYASQLPISTYLSIPVNTIKNVIKLRADASVSQATFTDDPLVAGTQHTLMTDTLGQFITKQVRAGDKVRAVYVGDGFGNETYQTFSVASITSNQVIRLVSGPSLAYASPIRYEIWRDLTETEQVQDFNTRAAAFANERVKVVYPDEGTRYDANQVLETVSGVYLAANLAGIRSAAPPHQSLRFLRLDDWADVTKSTGLYTSLLGQLTNCMVVGKLYTGEVVLKAANTTNVVSTETKEDVIVHNLDSVTKYFQAQVSSLRGRSNVVEATLSKIRGTVTSGANFLRTQTQVPELGSQILSATVVAVEQDPVLRDTVNVDLALTLPAPLNNITFRITVTV